MNLFPLCLPDDITGPYPEQFDDVMDFIEATIGRLRRSSDPSSGNPRGRKEQRQRGAANTGGSRGEGRGHGDKRRGRGRGGSRGGKAGRGDRGRDRISVQSRGCLLKEVHLNVTDLGLGYQTKEELIFRYCSGPCVEAETNYDKILNNLTHNKKLDKDTPSRTCCRPIAFDDDLSFLDDNVVYHTLKKHSARKCGCVWGSHIVRDRMTNTTCTSELRITFLQDGAAKTGKTTAEMDIQRWKGRGLCLIFVSNHPRIHRWVYWHFCDLKDIGAAAKKCKLYI